MDVEHADGTLERLERELRFTGGFSAEVVRTFRKRMWFIRQATDERDLYQAKGQHFERLKGARSHQSSTTLNKQSRLVLEMIDGNPGKKVKVIAIEDFH